VRERERLKERDTEKDRASLRETKRERERIRERERERDSAQRGGGGESERPNIYINPPAQAGAVSRPFFVDW
jgi:hypothetical protein